MRVDSSFFLPFLQNHIFRFFSGRAILSKLWIKRQTGNRREHCLSEGKRLLRRLDVDLSGSFCGKRAATTGRPDIERRWGPRNGCSTPKPRRTRPTRPTSWTSAASSLQNSTLNNILLKSVTNPPSVPLNETVISSADSPHSAPWVGFGEKTRPSGQFNDRRLIGRTNTQKSEMCANPRQ